MGPYRQVGGEPGRPKTGAGAGVSPPAIDEERVVAVATDLAQTAEAMHAHTLLRLDQLVEHVRDEWTAMAWPLLEELGDALANAWGSSRAEAGRYLELAARLQALGIESSGRARVALLHASYRIAQLEDLRRQVVGWPDE